MVGRNDSTQPTPAQTPSTIIARSQSAAPMRASAVSSSAPAPSSARRNPWLNRAAQRPERQKKHEPHDAQKNGKRPDAVGQNRVGRGGAPTGGARPLRNGPSAKPVDACVARQNARLALRRAQIRQAGRAPFPRRGQRRAGQRFHPFVPGGAHGQHRHVQRPGKRAAVHAAAGGRAPRPSGSSPPPPAAPSPATAASNTGRARGRWRPRR